MAECGTAAPFFQYRFDLGSDEYPFRDPLLKILLFLFLVLGMVFVITKGL